MHARVLRALLLVAFVLACLGCKGSKTGNGSSQVTPISGAPVPSVLDTPASPRQVLVDSGGRPISFAPLVRQSDPSVATVKTIERSSANGRGQILEGLGTAFVYDSSGYLLTNHHVIDKATDIVVGFRDGQEYQGKVVGADKRTDIAVLKVEAKGLPALPLGDSDEIEVGDWVVAIGNPFGLAHTISAGILSAKGRTRDDVKGLDETGYFYFLQTDASINPGNSGGPLLNMKGEVVGINAAIRKDANGIGFAIPMNMVKALIPMLLRDGHVSRSALGLTVGQLSADQAARLDLQSRKGAWVKSVQEGGPADRAGFTVDDVIVQFDGKPVDDPNSLQWNASIFGVGRTATVRIIRGGHPFEIKVTLGALPEEPDER